MSGALFYKNKFICLTKQFIIMARLNKDREIELQAKRIEYAVKRLSEINIIPFEQTRTEIRFLHYGQVITLWPYSGWFSGKGIKANRGIENLIKQLV